MLNINLKALMTRKGPPGISVDRIKRVLHDSSDDGYYVVRAESRARRNTANRGEPTSAPTPGFGTSGNWGVW